MPKRFKFKIDPCDYIRSSIDSYSIPSIIKELVQNADDAGATELHITMDWRDHFRVEEGKIDETFQPMLGPALIVRNNRPLQEHDVAALEHALNSPKRADALKVGQFGRGFVCVFNVTDFPAFVSRKHLYCLDPQEQILKEENVGEYYLAEEIWRDRRCWGEAFSAGGLPTDCVDFDQVIFRLPLRDPKQAKNSNIGRKRTFGRRAFNDLIGGAIKCSSALLLFAKYLERIAIDEIDTNGNRTLLWSIEIENTKEVNQHRMAMVTAASDWPQSAKSLDDQDEFSRIGDLFDRLESEGPTSRTWAVQFHFSGSKAQQSNTEWLVSSCLCVPQEGLTAEAGRKLLEVRKKAVPWAAVAAQIDLKDNRVVPLEAGFICCGLPVGDATCLPVHINGMFVLDDSRLKTLNSETNPFEMGWNAALYREVVATAYTLLLTNVREQFGVSEASHYYELMPLNDSIQGTHELKPLQDGLLDQLTAPECQCLSVQDAEGLRWAAPAEIRLPDSQGVRNRSAKGSNRQLTDAVIKLGYPQPEPTLPAHVRRWFQDSLAKPITPADIRQDLMQTADVDCEIRKAPKPCLQNESLIEALLRFCTEDSPTSLVGLPLAVCDDKKLHTFGFSTSPSKAIYRGTTEERWLLSEVPSWFLDPKFARKANVDQKKFEGLRQLETSELLESLAFFSRHRKTIKTLLGIEWKWYISREWSLRFVRYLNSAPNLTPASVSNLENIYFLETTNSYWSLGNAHVPLLAPPDLNNEALLQCLGQLGIPLISGTSDYLEEVRKLATKLDSPKRTLGTPTRILRLTPEQLASTLVARASEWQENELADACNIWTGIIDFLSSARLTDSDAEKLRSLKVLPTMQGTLAAADDSSVWYLADSFRLPEFGRSVVLCQKGDKDRWVGFLKQLKVRELGILEYLKIHLRNVIAELTSDELATAEIWFRDLVMKVSETSTDSKKEAINEQIRKQIRQVRLIKCTDGQRMHGNVLSIDNEIMRQVLGSDAQIPDMEYYHGLDPEWKAKDWERFFRKIGAKERPEANQLQFRIRRLMESAGGEGVASVADDLNTLFGHVIQHWHRFQGKDHESFRMFVRESAWVIGYQDGKLVAAFETPSPKLYRPSQVSVRQLARLVGTASPVAAHESPATDRAENEELGLQQQATSRQLAVQFAAALDAYEEATSLDRELAAEILHEIYDAIGSAVNSDRASDEFDRESDSVESIAEDVGLEEEAFARKCRAAGLIRYASIETELHGHDVTKARDLAVKRPGIRGLSRTSTPAADELWSSIRKRPCILDRRTGDVYFPEHVFLDDVTFFEPHWTTLQRQSQNFEKALIFLGCHATPRWPDYVALLQDIADGTDGEQVTSADERRRVFRALDRICELREQLADTSEVEASLLDEICDVIPVPADSWQLFPAHAVLKNDATWLATSINRDAVILLHDSVQQRTVETLRIKRLSAAVEPHLAEIPLNYPLGDDPVSNACRHLSQVMKTHEFYSGVERLLAFAHGEGEVSEWLRELSVERTSSIRLTYKLRSNGAIAGLREVPSWSMERTLWIVADSPEDVYEAAALALKERIAGSPPLDALQLSQILRAMPGHIDSVLDRHAIPKVTFTEDESVRSLYDAPDDDASDRYSSLVNVGIPDLNDPLRISFPRNETADGDDTDSRTMRTGTRRGSLGSAGDIEGDVVWDTAHPPLISSRLWRRAGDGSAFQPTTLGKAVPRARTVTGNSDVAEYARTQEHHVLDWILYAVLHFERTNNRKPEMTYENNCYHIISGSAEGKTDRKILVKCVEGLWRASPSRINRHELEFAKANSSEFWLYIVEHADDPERLKLHTIDRVFERLDGRLSELATQVAVPGDLKSEIDPGEPLRIPEKNEYVEHAGGRWRIVDVDTTDGMFQLTIVNPNSPRETTTVPYITQRLFTAGDADGETDS